MVSVTAVGCSTDSSSSQGGVSPGVDVQSHTITIGTTGPQTGPLSAAYESTYGAIARLASANNTVNGWKIKYIQLDDRYDPAKALANAQQLIQHDHVFAIVAQGGSPTNAAVLPYVVGSKTLDVGPVTESGVVLTKAASATNVFPFQPPYAQLAAYDLKYVHANVPGTYALAYQSGAAGAPALAGWQYEASQLGTSPAATVATSATANDFSGYAGSLKASGASTVLTWMAPNQLAALIQASNAIGFKPKWVADWPDLSSSFLELVGQAGNGMLFGNWVPPTVNPAPAVAKVIDSIKSATPDRSPSVTAVLGWIGMDIFIEGLTRATANGQTPTVASFTAALRNCAPFDAGGIGIQLSYCGDKLPAQQDSMYVWDGTALKVVSGPEDVPAIPTANLEGH
jgi:branched-chain amino acid transport system substrate-binding protein